ncbi:hypothetical protein [Tomitella cavernea]|uniref:Uncharacterized protein n=1 Tax=Tomitella cavernea TaxID=1387982 RepID=A0ABP9D336_9ACTN|nr:hypothetical protein [Tomitella cavernea]
METYEIALMHANGQPAPDNDHARQLYRELDDVIALLGTHPPGQSPDGATSGRHGR